MEDAHQSSDRIKWGRALHACKAAQGYMPSTAHVTPFNTFKIAATSIEDLGSMREKTVSEIQRLSLK